MNAQVQRNKPLRGVVDWWFRPIALGRVAALRTFVYAFVFVDVLILRPWVSLHAAVPTELYEPLFIAKFLPEPTPTSFVVPAVQIALLVSAALALTGRWQRFFGAVVFVTYLQWMLIAFSYGKVDHDNVAFLVALAVLPTVGPAHWGDKKPTEAAGWAIRCVQVAVAATYFASVFAKLRFGGINWVTGSTFTRAIVRRGTPLVEPLQNHPAILRAGQFALVSFELLSPLLLARGRFRTIMLTMAFTFHIVTFVSIKIMFWPHVLCLLAFFPLEKLDPASWLRARSSHPALARFNRRDPVSPG